MNVNDELLEKKIQKAWERLVGGLCDQSKRDAFENMRRLVAMRSDERVKQMESERGLR